MRRRTMTAHRRFRNAHRNDLRKLITRTQKSRQAILKRYRQAIAKWGKLWVAHCKKYGGCGKKKATKKGTAGSTKTKKAATTTGKQAGGSATTAKK